MTLTPSAAWVLLIVAGVLETVWAIGLKYADGFTKFWPSVITLVAALLSFWALAMSLKTLPVGTAYAVWTGIGALGAAVLGIILFNEPLSAARVLCLSLIVGGILGLKWLG